MPWVKLDDRFPSHRKIALLSDRAFRLHISAICWCSENLTDGRITDRELTLVAHIRGLKATAKQLEEAGVWDRTEDGWVIHDFLDYNPSREQVIAERKKNAERQERFRQRRNGKPVPPDDKGRSNGVTPHGPDAPETHERSTTATRRRHDGDTTATGNRREEQTDPHVNGVRNGVTNGAPSRPVPSRPKDMADVGGESAGSEAPEAWPEGPPAPIDTDGFTVTDSMRRWANDVHPHVDLQHSTNQFVAHYRSTGTRRKNWPEAWRKWIAEDSRRGAARPQQGAFLLPLPGGNQTPLTPRRSTTDDRVAAGLALAAELRALEEGNSA